MKKSVVFLAGLSVALMLAVMACPNPSSPDSYTQWGTSTINGTPIYVESRANTTNIPQFIIDFNTDYNSANSSDKADMTAKITAIYIRSGNKINYNYTDKTITIGDTVPFVDMLAYLFSNNILTEARIYEFNAVKLAKNFDTSKEAIRLCM